MCWPGAGQTMCSFRPSKIIKSDLLKDQTVCSFDFSPLSVDGGGFTAPAESDEFIPLQIRDCTQPAAVVPPAPEQEVAMPEDEPAALSAVAGISEDELQLQLQDAFNRGLEEGRRQAERGLSNVFKALRDGITGLTDLRDKVMRESEADLLTLSIMVARKIIQREISLDPQILAGVITTALDAVTDLDRVTIRLNPEDYQLVSSDRERFITGIGRDNQVTLTPDEQIMRGGCMVDTPTGTIDARIETQLEEIFHRFMEERGTPVDFISGVGEGGGNDADR